MGQNNNGTVLPAGTYRIVEVRIREGSEIFMETPFIVLRARFLTRPDECKLEVLTLCQQVEEVNAGRSEVAHQGD